MRHLSFKTYLRQYVLDLSDHSSFSIHKLVKESEKIYRMRDSLVLYCALYDKKHLLNKYYKGKYAELVSDLTFDNFRDPKYIDHDFAKIWDCYINKIKRYEYDNEIKSKMRIKILKMMEEKNISNYRVYKDLGLNPGNINDYLSNGNSKKLSLETAKKIYYFVEEYKPQKSQ